MPTADAPHLLYVAWGFPPARSGGVYRALATANAFAEKGWRVTVLTADRETFTMNTGVDRTLEAQVNPAISVIRVPFTAPSYHMDIRTWSFWRAHAPELWKGYRAKADPRAFPEPKYGGWRSAIEKTALRIHREDPVHLTIGTANPHVDFTPGYRLHERFRVPYVMDYRDAWQLDVFSGDRLTDSGSAVARWERRLVQDAHEIWFVNQPILEWHTDQYPSSSSKMRVVANGYDATMARFSPRVREGRDDGLVFGYIGTISGFVPLRELFEGWAAARRASTILASSRIELYGYLNYTATPNEDIVKLLAEYEDHGVVYKGPVGRADISSTYDSFDALLLALGTGRYVTSGKVYEYAATGLPIAAIHDPGNAATGVLEHAPQRVGTKDLKPDSIAKTLVDLAQMARTQTEQQRLNAQAWASQYERSQQLLPRIDSLRADVSDGIVAKRPR